MTAGRPPALGVDVGGTRIKGGLVDTDGVVLARASRPTPDRIAEAARVEDAIVDLVEELLARPEAAGGVSALGVGAAGLVDAERGRVVFAPHLSWRDEPLQERLTARLQLPVLVDNDAHAAAWGEFRFGAGRGESHLVLLTLGTGIGGAILTGGVLQRGKNGLAGEFGHQQVVPEGRRCECGNAGCWEQYASGNALRREAQEIVRTGGRHAEALTTACSGDPERLAGEHVTQAARAGDPASIELLTQVGTQLGIGIAGLVAALDPGTVVVGGGVSGAGELLLDPARSAFARHLLGRGHRDLPALVLAELGPEAGLIGAADLAAASVRSHD